MKIKIDLKSLIITYIIIMIIKFAFFLPCHDTIHHNNILYYGNNFDNDESFYYKNSCSSKSENTQEYISVFKFNNTTELTYSKLVIEFLLITMFFSLFYFILKNTKNKSSLIVDLKKPFTIDKTLEKTQKKEHFLNSLKNPKLWISIFVLNILFYLFAYFFNLLNFDELSMIPSFIITYFIFLIPFLLFFLYKYNFISKTTVSDISINQKENISPIDLCPNTNNGKSLNRSMEYSQTVFNSQVKSENKNILETSREYFVKQNFMKNLFADFIKKNINLKLLKEIGLVFNFLPNIIIILVSFSALLFQVYSIPSFSWLLLIDIIGIGIQGYLTYLLIYIAIQDYKIERKAFFNDINKIKFKIFSFNFYVNRILYFIIKPILFLLFFIITMVFFGIAITFINPSFSNHFILICVIPFYSYIIAYFFGKKRRIGFTWSFLFCLLLTPVFGILIVMLSPKHYNDYYKPSIVKKITGITIMVIMAIIILLLILNYQDLNTYSYDSLNYINSTNHKNNEISEIFTWLNLIGSILLGYYIYEIGKGIEPEEELAIVDEND